jgi:hypothetical protein
MPIRALPNGHFHTSTAWSPSTGTGGRHPLEPVVVIDWNWWSSSIGKTGRHHPVHAVFTCGGSCQSSTCQLVQRI